MKIISEDESVDRMMRIVARLATLIMIGDVVVFGFGTLLGFWLGGGFK